MQIGAKANKRPGSQHINRFEHSQGSRLPPLRPHECDYAFAQRLDAQLTYGNLWKLLTLTTLRAICTAQGKHS